MLLPSDLARMRLGVRWDAGRVVSFNPAAAYPSPLPGAYSRIIGTPRIAGDNQALGDCVPVGCANAVQTAMARAGVTARIPDEVPIAAYSAVTGYTPVDPASDQGTDPLKMFDWWQKNDLAGWRLRNATAIDPTAETAFRRVIDETGGIAVVVALALEQQNQRIWMPAGTPGSWGYHFAWLDGWDGALTWGTSWGDLQGIDRSYFNGDFTKAAYALDLVQA